MLHFGLLFLIFVCHFADCQQQANLWPLPQQVATGSDSVALDPKSFQFVCGGDSCTDVLTIAFKRYRHYVFFAEKHKEMRLRFQSPSVDVGIPILSQVIVNAQRIDDLQLGVDESYTIAVNSSVAVINAKTEWGALHGLETFSQLVEWDADTDVYSINVVPVTIEDFPRFPWRGLLLDSARHFEPLRVIFKAIEALTFNKMNVLHWHIVDDQSFPYVSTTYPNLSDAAWTSRAVYSPQDVQDVVQYGYLRGVRVLVEFDTPGHTASWRVGYPELFPNCTNAAPTLNPTTDYTINFMTNLLTEVSSVFPDEFIHLGGDEVQPECWQQDASIAAWMKSHNVASYKGLQAYYENVINGIITNLNRSGVYWEEVFDNSAVGTLSTDSVVHVWFSGTQQVGNVVKAGYRALYSSSWYLDQQIPNGNETFYFWVDTWKDFYDADPVSGLHLTPSQLALVLGGEACMWGEAVDERAFDQRVWPRAAAVGERLWSDQSIKDHNAATPRLGNQRCRMVRRGIRASPIYPDYCETGRDPRDLDH